jgi:hypothetical protein
MHACTMTTTLKICCWIAPSDRPRLATMSPTSPRGAMPTPTIRKVKALAAYIAGPYQQQFGTQSVTLAYITTGGRRRAEELLGWAESALSEQRQQAGYFLFSAFDPAEADPLESFLAPRFLQPFRRASVPLLEPP